MLRYTWVAGPAGFYPDSTIEKKPDPDLDPTSEKNLDPLMFIQKYSLIIPFVKETARKV